MTLWVSVAYGVGPDGTGRRTVRLDVGGEPADAGRRCRWQYEREHGTDPTGVSTAAVPERLMLQAMGGDNT